MMNRWHGNTGRVERLEESRPAGALLREPDGTERGGEAGAPARRLPSEAIRSLRGVETEDLLLGLILYLLYRESRDEEFLIMLAAMFLG